MQYFKKRKEQISFEIEKIPITIKITDVYVYPQAYAAALTVHDDVSESRIINIVDLGGYTVDLLQLTDFRPDMSVCTSLYNGVNTLFRRINEQIRAKMGKDIPDVIIEGIITEDSKVLQDCSPERLELVRTNTENFTNKLLWGTSQEGLDLTENQTVFVGGGALLLREYIEKSGMVAKAVFVPNIHANVQGYQLIYDKMKTPRV